MHRVLGRITDQPARVAHLVHHLVAAVDARGAADALVLQSVADIDTGRARLHADAAIDAGAETHRLRVGGFTARAARLAALGIVGDHQRVRIEHHALEARVRAHMFAHLLAHPAGVAVSSEAVEQDPERLPRAQRIARNLGGERFDRREITHERKPGPQRERDPGRMLCRFQSDLAQAGRLLIELHACHAIAFDPALDPHEDFGINGLRTCVAAPQAAGHRRKQEQRQRGDDQQCGQEDEVLRPQHHAEYVELARRQVEQHRLPPVPGQPRGPVKRDLGEHHQRDAPTGEPAVHRARMYGATDFVEIEFDRRTGWRQLGK